MEQEKTDTKEASRPFIDRELSWLAFNYRVLQEAKDPQVPLLERIKFMAIFSANLDEYFKVRVATIKRLIKLKKKTRQKLAQQPLETFELLIKEIRRQQDELGVVFKDIINSLSAEGINLLTQNDLSPDQEAFVQQYLKDKLAPLVHPIMLDDTQTHLFLKDQTVYLGVHLTEPKDTEAAAGQVAIIEIPTKRHGSRFVKLPTVDGKRYVMFIDDAIRYYLPQLFPAYGAFDAHAVKVSRDAELDIEEEVSENLMAKIKKSLKKRETGFPARLLYDPTSPDILLKAIMDHTGILEDALVEGSKYHNFRDFFQFPDFNLPELKYTPQPTLAHPKLEHEPSLLAAMQKEDYLVHYPYQSFDYVIRLFNEAADDPNVTSVSATLYRVAEDSAIAKALIKAANNGKLVTVVVELKARFDEESNILWAGKLQKAGANVILGLPGLKVHSKLGLITRNEKGKLVNYAYLSTGNYNEQTSKIYTDHALFTSNPAITKEVDEVFNFLLDQHPDKKFDKLLVAPINLRDRFMELVNREIKHAKKGLPASMILKMNALQDERMIKKLYAASEAGVKIQLIVRGICCLVPGADKISENIQMRSIVDRYLEHARVYVFHNNGNEEYYIASADWMTRNLNRRVEVAFPLTQPDLVAEVRTILDLQLQDNTKARYIDNSYIGNPNDEEQQAVRAQYDTYHYLRSLLPEGNHPERMKQ